MCCYVFEMALVQYNKCEVSRPPVLRLGIVWQPLNLADPTRVNCQSNYRPFLGVCCDEWLTAAIPSHNCV